MRAQDISRDNECVRQREPMGRR